MTNYSNGASRERRFVNRLKEEGFIAFRSAGSHSPIDVVAIHKESKMIYFIQCKPRRMSPNAKRRLQAQYSWLDDVFHTQFKVCSVYAELNSKQEE